MKKFITLLEELTTFQRNYTNEKLGGREYNPEESHTDMFDSYHGTGIRNENRLMFKQDLSSHLKAVPEIKIHLKSHGWDIHNYHAGLASRQVKDRDGNDKLEIKKIGKVLQQTGGDKVLYSKPKDRLIKDADGKPLIGNDGRMKSEQVPQSLLDYYNADKTRDSVKSEHNIIISRDLDDIAGMTSGRNWEKTSCMRLPDSDHEYDIGGVKHEKIKADLKHHTLIAYSIKKGDDNIESPVGRVLIKKYTSEDGHTIYRPEKTTYGNPPEGFTNQIEELMKKHYPSDPSKKYDLDYNLYDDGRDVINPIKVGLHRNGSITRNYNENGELHDYIDEHGVKQPAVKYDSGEYTHYKNGKLHNENGVAKKCDDFNYHYINGELHRDGNLPTVYNDDGSHVEYHYGGIRHTDGSTPSIKLNTNNESQTTYHYAGMEHSPNKNTPSNVTKNAANEKVEYKKYGVLHSPDNDTPSIVHHRYYKKSGSNEFIRGVLNTKTTEFYKNGELHRDEDKPAQTIYSQDSNITTNNWYKNGELHREGDKPYTESTDLNGNKPLQVWGNRCGVNKPSIIENINGDTHSHYKNDFGSIFLSKINGKDGNNYTVHQNDGKVIFGDKAIQLAGNYGNSPTHTIIHSGDNIHIIDHRNNDIKTIDKHGVTYKVNGDESLIKETNLMYQDPSHIDKLKHMADIGTKTISDKPINTDFLDNATSGIDMDKHNNDRIDEIYKRVHGNN